MNRRRAALISGAGAVGIAAGVAVGLWRSAPPKNEAAGAPKPAFGTPTAAFLAQHFEQPDGGSLSMPAWRGRRLLVNFWATWCAPCVREMPLLDRFHREQGEQGWRVLGLAVDSAPAVRAYLTKVPVSFPIGLAGLAGMDLLRRLGNTQGGLPFTVLIHADGRLVWHKAGETTLDELVAQTKLAG